MDKVTTSERIGVESEVAAWLDGWRASYLKAAEAAGLGGSVETERLVVVELTESGSKTEGRVQKVNPLLLPGVAWTLRAESESDRDSPIADLIYRVYGHRADVNVGFYPGLFLERPTEWIAKVLLPATRWEYVTSLQALDRPDEELAVATARKLIQLLEADELTSVTMLPLDGLRASQRIESGRAVLRPITPDEYLELSEPERSYLPGGVLRHARRFQFHNERTVLEFRHARPKRSQDTGDISGIRRLIVAFQLLGFDPAGSGQAVTVTEPLRLGAVRGSPIALAEHGARRDVGASDLERAVELAERIPAGALTVPRTHEEIAIARFQTAVNERSHSDAIVDHVIALEATLLRSVRDELRFRFALYGAWFLGADRTDRLRLADELKDLYDARSAIVHGTPLPSHRLEPLAALARSISSATIVRALRQGWPTEQSLVDALFG